MSPRGRWLALGFAFGVLTNPTTPGADWARDHGDGYAELHLRPRPPALPVVVIILGGEHVRPLEATTPPEESVIRCPFHGVACWRI